MNKNEALMSKCIKNAYKAKGSTKTNPLVGAAVCTGDDVFFGIHEKYGFAHAEVNAINNAGDKAFKSELFVTLEPCSTYGKTPPCVDKIINAGIKKVYVGVLDVNPKHAGRGISILKNAGIDVEYGILPDKSSILIEDFIKYHRKQLPYVTLKTAISLDGKIAAYTGDSKWVTCEKSRQYAHKLRGECDAVITGVGTVLADNPLMTNRMYKKLGQPARIILDSFLKTPVDLDIIKSVDISPVIIYTSKNIDNKKADLLKSNNVEIIEVDEYNGMLDLESILKSLYNKGFMNVLVEAGAKINGSFFDLGLVDKLEAFIAPKIIGGENAVSCIGGKGIASMSQAYTFKSSVMRKSGDDIHITARINDYTKEVIEFTKNFQVE